MCTIRCLTDGPPPPRFWGQTTEGTCVGYLLAREGWMPVKTTEAGAVPVAEFRLRPMVANVRFLKQPGVRTSYARSSVPVMNTLPSLTQGPIECRSILAQEKSVARPAMQDCLKKQALMRSAPGSIPGCTANPVHRGRFAQKGAKDVPWAYRRLRAKPAKNPVPPPNKRQYGVLPELPIRIELMTFSLRVKRSTD